MTAPSDWPAYWRDYDERRASLDTLVLLFTFVAAACTIASRYSARCSSCAVPIIADGIEQCWPCSRESHRRRRETRLTTPLPFQPMLEMMKGGGL